jgi:chromosomal replication initiation ATPase DnaA
MRNVKRLAAENQVIVVENVLPRHNDEALFHLFNIFNEEGKYMLWTAEKPANSLHFSLPDLQTRLNMLPSVAISEPDDMMLQMLIAKLFNDRQIIISQEVLDYILNYAERSFNYITRLIAEIDDISWTYGRAVSVSIVRDAINNLSKNQQLDLFI